MGNIDPDTHYISASKPISHYYIENKFNNIPTLKNKLTFFNTNIRCLPKNFDKLKYFLFKLNHNFSILSISETWLKQYHKDNYNLKGYSHVSKIRLKIYVVGFSSDAALRFAGYLRCDSLTIMKSFLKKIAREFTGNLHKDRTKFPENSRAIFLRNDFIIVRLSHLRNRANRRAASDEKPTSSGGTSIFVRSDINFKIKENISVDLPGIDSIAIEIHKDELNSTKNVIVLALYRPPNINAAQLIVQLTDTMQTLHEQNKHVFLMGDFNIDITEQC